MVTFTSILLYFLLTSFFILLFFLAMRDLMIIGCCFCHEIIGQPLMESFVSPFQTAWILIGWKHIFCQIAYSVTLYLIENTSTIDSISFINIFRQATITVGNLSFLWWWQWKLDRSGLGHLLHWQMVGYVFIFTAKHLFDCHLKYITFVVHIGTWRRLNN